MQIKKIKKKKKKKIRLFDVLRKAFIIIACIILIIGIIARIHHYFTVHLK